MASLPLGDLSTEDEGKKVTVVAMVNNVRRVITKKSTTMGIVVLEDMSGTVETGRLPRVLREAQQLLRRG